MGDEHVKTKFMNVQSAGNSWVICKSKRYLNQVYYFNTLTGQSVWNLSEQEIQKTKQKTQINDEQKGFAESRLHDFPEPMEPPVDVLQSLNKPNCSYTTTPSECNCVCNKDLPHNQMSNTVYKVVHCCCGPKNEHSHPTSNRNYNFNDHSAFNHCNRSNVVKRIPLDYSEQTLDENCECCNKYPFKHAIACHTTCGQSNSSELINNKINLEWQRNNEEYSDLREKIFKKKICLRKNAENCKKGNVEPMRYPDEYNCNIHKDTIFEEHKTLEKLKLDMSRLRLLADEKFNTWFMVLDSSVLLHYDVTHIDFLQLLLRSDERCRLVVPQHVLVEVREAANGGTTRLAALANRAHRYLNTLLDRDIAFIGPEPTKNNDPNKSHIIRCCLKLYEENLPVILLSEETNTLEETSRIPIFSIQKLKEFLSDGGSNKKKYVNDFINKLPVGLNSLTIDNVMYNRNTDTNTDTILSKRDLTDKIPVELNNYAVSNVVDNSNVKVIRSVYTQSKKKSLFNVNDYNNKAPIDTNCLTIGNVNSRNPKITATHLQKDFNLNLHDFTHRVPIGKNSLTVGNVVHNINPKNLKNIDHQSKQYPDINDFCSELPVERNCLTVKNVVDSGNSKQLKNTDDQPKQNSCLNVKDIKSPVKIKTVDNVKETSENVKNAEPPPKKRTIRLNRNIALLKSSNSDEIRNFKWRSKRFVNSNNKEIARQNEKRFKDMCTQTQQDDEHNKLVLEKDTQSQQCDEQFVQQNTDMDTRMDDNMDSSESSSVPQKNSCANVIVEESSTSGVISNSYVDSDSERCVDSKYVSNNESGMSLENVMFEIRDTVMEEQLKTGREEWMSRFVQIMEEVLTQVLEKDPSFFEKSMPPPWSLHEAATCIIKKFNGQPDIINAAKKLEDHLSNVSNYKGKIDINMTPIDFMKMYSYGVYLVDTLQTHLNNNEDLQNAASSLAKLLGDIENPKRDCPDPCGKSRDQILATPFSVNDYSCGEGSSDNFFGSPPANNKKNYKSKRDIQEIRKFQVVNDYIISINKDKRGKFFSNLNLREISPSTGEHLSREAINHSPSKTNCMVIPDESQTNNFQQERGTNNNEGRLEKNITDIGNNTNSNNNNETAKKENIVFKITRTFNKCPKFEEKLKHNGLLLEEVYSEENTDQSNPQDNNDDEYASEDSYDHSSSNIDKSKELLDDFFKSFIRKTINTLRDLYNFCCEAREELNNAEDRISTNINGIQKDLKLYKIEVQNLSSCLKSIFERKMTQYKVNFELAGVKIFSPNEEQIQKYRRAVQMCMNQANILSETIEALLNVCCT